VSTAEDDPDEDNMEEIDTSNILGRRTRGKNIDFAEAAQKAKEAGDTLEDDEDEEDDEDFEEAEVGDADRMEE
jgi:Histone chaperone domain CHZ